MPTDTPHELRGTQQPAAMASERRAIRGKMTVDLNHADLIHSRSVGQPFNALTFSQKYRSNTCARKEPSGGAATNPAARRTDKRSSAACSGFFFSHIATFSARRASYCSGVIVFRNEYPSRL
jgi:hypothetical protein